VRKSRQYNRNYLRLWFRWRSSPYLFSLILSLTIEFYYSPINKLHSVPQVLIPILIEMFLVVFLLGFPSFLSFSCVVSCSHAPCNFGSIKKTWAIPYISKTHIFSWWSWWESHPCLKSYWTTSSLLTEKCGSVIFRKKGIPERLIERVKRQQLRSTILPYLHSEIPLIKEPCCCPCTSIPSSLSLRTSHESSSPF